MLVPSSESCPVSIKTPMACLRQSLARLSLSSLLSYATHITAPSRKMEDDGTANRSAAEREALAVLTAMSQINARSTSQRLPPSRPASRASSTDAPPPKPSPSPSPAPSPPPTTTPSHRPHRGVARPWVPPPVPDPPAEALKRLKPYICSYLACDARYDTVLESLEHEKDCLRRLDGARQVNTFSCLEEPSGCRIRFNDYAKMLVRSPSLFHSARHQ